MAQRITREQANDLLHKYVKGEHYITHSYAVEAIMRALAKRLAPDDVEYWGIVGLLHDLDEETCDWRNDMSTHGPVSAEILKKEGFDLVSGGTDNHLILIDLTKHAITGKELETRLDSVGITVNKNSVPNDPYKPTVTGGIRIGTPSVTTRGLNSDDMEHLAHLIALTAFDFENSQAQVRNEVNGICDRYPIYR